MLSSTYRGIAVHPLWTPEGRARSRGGAGRDRAAAEWGAGGDRGAPPCSVRVLTVRPPCPLPEFWLHSLLYYACSLGEVGGARGYRV